MCHSDVRTSAACGGQDGDCRGEEAVSRARQADLMLVLSLHCHPGEVIFYSALFSFLLNRMGTGREPAVGGPAGHRKKQTGAPLRSAWHDHTQCPSRLCRLCPQPLLRLSAFPLGILPCRPVDSHGSLRGSPEYNGPILQARLWRSRVTLQVTA